MGWAGSGIGDIERIEDVTCGNENEDTGEVCTFEDEVDVLYADNGYRIWTCPKCSYEHYDDSSDYLNGGE